MLGEEVAFSTVGVAREHKGIDSRCPVCLQLGDDLIRITNDGGSGAAAGASDPSPQVVFGVPIIAGLFTQLCLSRNTH